LGLLRGPKRARQSTSVPDKEPDKYPLLAVMHSYLCDQHSTRGWSDGQTDFFFIQTAEPEGWLLLTRSPNSITFVSDELYRKLPELNLEQEYKLVTEESGGWSFVFATSWEELLVYDVQDPEDSGCPIKEFLEADPDRALAIILSDEGGIDQWIGYNIALPGETPSWDTPQEPINWEGFEQFAEKLG
jgi:hypothetical protein